MSENGDLNERNIKELALSKKTGSTRRLGKIFPGRDHEPGPKVLIIGSGFAGYFATRRLERRLRGTGVQLAMLSATDGFLYSPLLADVAAGAVDPRSVVVPLSGTLAGVTIVCGRVHG